jgi:hypothetical protein
MDFLQTVARDLGIDVPTIKDASPVGFWDGQL